jgi:signal transduction histidine kinase
MKSFCEDTLEGINYKFIIDDENVFESLSLDKKRNMYLVLKESVHNIVKHAAADEVTISIYKNDKKVIFEIVDNGKGFEIKDTEGNGLKSLQKRAEEINAVIRIISTPGQGTKILLELH